jgi:hypothetical protein
LPRRGDDRQLLKLVDRITQLAWIAQIDRKALQALDRLANVLTADRKGDELLHVGEAQAKTRRTNAVNTHFDISSAADSFGVRGAGSRHGLHRCLNLLADPLDHL